MGAKWRLLEARGGTGRHLEARNEHGGPSWDLWDRFLSLPFTAIFIGACLPGCRHIVPHPDPDSLMKGETITLPPTSRIVLQETIKIKISR